MRTLIVFIFFQIISCGYEMKFENALNNKRFINLINEFINNKVTIENMFVPTQKEGYIMYYGGGAIVHVSNYKNYKPDYIDKRIKYKNVDIIQNYNATKSCASYEINTIVTTERYSFSILQYVPTYDRKCSVKLIKNEYYSKDNPKEKSIDFSKRLIDYFSETL